jgi:hypothetical protein
MRWSAILKPSLSSCSEKCALKLCFVGTPAAAVLCVLDRFVDATYEKVMMPDREVLVVLNKSL